MTAYRRWGEAPRRARKRVNPTMPGNQFVAFQLVCTDGHDAGRFHLYTDSRFATFEEAWRREGPQMHGADYDRHEIRVAADTRVNVGERDCFDVFFAVVFPHDADHDRHWLAERVPRPLGLKGVEDALSAGLPGRRRLDVLHPASVEQMFGAV